MELYPAVDIRGGRVAHVRRGAAATPSAFGDDPAAAVRRLAADGARWVHLVDLDRADDTGSNRDLIRAILAEAPIPIQVGGSLRTEAAIDEMIEWGAARVVIGCAAAAADAGIVGRLLARHERARLAVAIDATEGRVTPRGAAGSTRVALSVEELAHRVRGQGAATVVYSNVTRDGTLAGCDVAGARALAGLGLDVVASGGIGTLADIREVRDAGLAGAIAGRALHEGRFTLREALTCAAG